MTPIFPPALHWLAVTHSIVFGGYCATQGPPDRVSYASIQVLDSYSNNQRGCYALELYATGDLTAVTVTGPGGISLTLQESAAFPGVWIDSMDLPYVPEGAYQFTFDTPTGTDVATLHYAATALATRDYAHVQWPHPGDAYAPGEPSFQWRIGTQPAGTYIKAEVTNERTGIVAGPVELDIYETTWSPEVSLAPGELHELVIDVINESYSTETTASGDDFTYDAKFSHSNFVEFTTCACSSSLPAIPITATIQGIGNAVIGEITTKGFCETASGGGPLIASRGNEVVGTFWLANAYRDLDRCYDFRWINVRDDYLVDGLPEPYIYPFTRTRVPMPSIDPAPGQPVDGDLGDGAPYYYDNDHWNASLVSWPHIETRGSRFADLPDHRAAPPAGETLRFKTFLVVQDKGAGLLGNKELLVLDGFSWIYDEDINRSSLCRRLPPDPGLVQRALDQTPKVLAGGFPSTWINFIGPAFSGWTVRTSATSLLPCPP